MIFRNIFNVKNLEYEKWEMNINYLGQTAEIAKRIGTAKLGFHVEILPPKKYSCPYHYHDSEEELFLVLEGEATLRQDDNYCKITQGDLIFFGLGIEFSHQFYNHSECDFKFLAISNLDKSDIAYYPDSGKINVRKSREIFKLEDKVPYLTDEENPNKYWKK